MTVYTVFGQTGSGALVSSAGAFTLGLQFSLSQPATLTGYWWYSASGAVNLPATCAVYAVSGGTQVSGSLVSTPSWSGAAGSGWVRCAVAGGPTLASGTQYVVALFGAGGANWFSDTSAYFTSGPGGSGLTSGIITVPNNAGGTHGQGPDNSGSPIAFPATSSAGFNFWVDVEVTTATAAAAPYGALRQPVQARIIPAAQPASGQVRSGRGGPVSNPVPGPPFRQAPQPVRARIPQNAPRGRVSANPGAPVRNPVPAVTGPPFYPARQPARIRPALPPRGRTASNPGGPVRNPQAGPLLLPAGQPAGGPVILLRTGLAMATPVPPPPANPAPGPLFRPCPQAIRARLPQQPPLRGRTASNPGGPVRNPVPTGVGPAFFPAAQPARTRPPQPPRGRITGSQGAPARNPAPGAAFPAWRGPAQARIPLPPRGRTAGNPGSPVVAQPVFTGPRFTPRRDPARIRPSLPPRGRASGNPGAPVRNPGHGPVFIQKPWPARIRIPQNAPRGRTASNPGGPVANIPFGHPLFRLGTPYFQWQTGTSVFAWAAGTPQTSA